MTQVKFVSDDKIIKKEITNETLFGEIMEYATSNFDVYGDHEIIIKFKKRQSTLPIQSRKKLFEPISDEQALEMLEKIKSNFPYEIKFTIEEFKDYLKYFSEENFKFIPHVFISIEQMIKRLLSEGLFRIQELEELLGGRIIFDFNCEDGISHVMDAAIIGDTKLVEYFLDRGVDIESCCIYGGWNALEAASGKGKLDIVELLLNRGAKCDKQFYSSTPLIAAAKNGHFDIVKLLLKAGARKTCREILERDSNRMNDQNYRGDDAYETALKNGHAEIAEYILKWNR